MEKLKHYSTHFKNYFNNYFIKALDKYLDGRRFLYAVVAGETKILDYYNRREEYKFCINNNSSNCIFIINAKKDKN